MALKAKCINVAGQTEYVGGLATRNLAKKVEVAVDAALAGLDHESVVDIKINTTFNGVGGDSAFILILYKDEKKETKVEQKQEEEKEVKRHWSKK